MALSLNLTSRIEGVARFVGSPVVKIRQRFPGSDLRYGTVPFLVFDWDGHELGWEAGARLD